MELQEKVVVGLAGAIAGWLGTKALASVWKVATGKTAPDDPQDPERTMTEAVVFAALSGALIGAVRVLATRSATKYVSNRQIIAAAEKAGRQAAS